MRRRPLLLLLPWLAALPARLPAQAALVELNSADRADLESLPGIGPALAERLLAARAGAPFRDWAELRRRVKGLGPASLRRLSAQGLRVQGRPYEEDGSAPLNEAPGAAPPSSAAAPPPAPAAGSA